MSASGLRPTTLRGHPRLCPGCHADIAIVIPAIAALAALIATIAR